MYNCPECKEELGMLGVEKSGRYTASKQWYEFAKHETRCKFCKAPIRAVFLFTKTRYVLIFLLLIAIIILMVFGASVFDSVAYKTFFGFVIVSTLINSFLIRYEHYQ
ncbi:hypothetical protein SAMN02745866_04269 [Alteromonadaceae bacterium Bs31]|nr:hypothetical protein SAMN02745866_04269 [Alteromonadaceae bacterium Bs31]